MLKEKEMIIDLKDYLAFILKRWMAFVGVAIICALLIGGYKTIDSIVNSNEDPYSDERKEALVNRLTAAETKEVENLYNRYVAYKNRISYSEDTINHSVLMKLNPEKLPFLNVQYSISSDQQNIISSFSSNALGVEDYRKIALVFGEDTDYAGVSELISISGTSNDRDGIALDVDNQHEYYVGNVNNVYNWILNIGTYAYSESQCGAIMGILEEAIRLHYQSLVNAGISVSMIRIGSNYTENNSRWLAERQRSLISETSSLKSEYDSFEKAELINLTDEEKNYFTFLKNRYEGRAEEQSRIKYYAYGGIGGVLLSFLIYSLYYFCSSRIRNMGDYLYRTGTDNILGIVYSVVKNKGAINSFIQNTINKVLYGIERSYDTKEKTNITAMRILQICTRENIGELFIVDESTKTSASSVIDSISEFLSNNGIIVFKGKPLSSSKDFGIFEKTKAVLYYGSFHDSKTETLSDYQKLFNENKSLIVGSVLHGEV